MKKVRIMTIFEAINNGAALQALALMRIIEKLLPDADIKILNYRPTFTENDLRLIRTQIGHGWKKYAHAVFDLLFFFERSKKLKAYSMFRSKYFSLTEAVSTEQIQGGTCEVDCLVSGSDQIWNPYITDNDIDPVYYATFANESCRVISYASSMGEFHPSTEQGELAEKAINCLKQYDYLSVRERSTAIELESILNRNVETVLDPTLLMTAEEWRALFAIPQSECKAKRYIFVYSVGSNHATKKIVSLAKRIANERNLEVYLIGGELPYSGVKVLRSVAPDRFVEYIANAELVLTNSFHGTIFSILFHKEFRSIQNSNSPGRSLNLLKDLGLMECYIQNIEEDSYSDTRVDYSLIDCRLEEYRAHSIAYLKEALDC